MPKLDLPSQIIVKQKLIEHENSQIEKLKQKIRTANQKIKSYESEIEKFQKKLEEIEMQKIKAIAEKNGMSIDDVIEIIERKGKEQNILNKENDNGKI